MCGEVSTEAIRYSTLHRFQAKVNWLPKGPYQSFHVTLDALIIDLLKKAAKCHRNARLNFDDKQWEDAEGADGASGAQRTIACPQLIPHEKRTVQIIFIETLGAVAVQAHQLRWVMDGNASSNKSCWQSFGTTL